MKEDPFYTAGFNDGLRFAIEIVREMEDAAAVKRQRSYSHIKVRDSRATREGAYRVARTRITTRLKTRERNRVPSTKPIARRLEEMGL